jgi:hypothetical protein
MKKNHLLPLYNSNSRQKSPKEKSTDQPAESKTPYLKAILSGTTKLIAPENDLPAINPDREAALRYIKESSFIKRLSVGKMSC